MTKRTLLNEMTRDEIREIAPTATLVIPTAATEQHGPHLPVVTDCIIGGALAARSAEIAAAEIPIVVGPVVPFGNSHHHLIYTALSLRTETYVTVLKDLLDCALQSGFRRIFFFNSHGGNDECIRIAARDLVLKNEASVGACSYWTATAAVAAEAGVRDVGFFPGHAGGFETAMMMALAPELVRTGKLPRHENHPVQLSNAGITNGWLMVKSGEWQRIDGYSDTPVRATPEAGKRLFYAIAAGMARVLVTFHKAAG